MCLFKHSWHFRKFAQCGQRLPSLTVNFFTMRHAHLAWRKYFGPQVLVRCRVFEEAGLAVVVLPASSWPAAATLAADKECARVCGCG